MKSVFGARWVQKLASRKVAIQENRLIPMRY
jgi:hypothetical protein